MAMMRRPTNGTGHLFVRSFHPAAGVPGQRSQRGNVLSPQIDQQIASRLTAFDIRYTQGRRRVTQALARADGPRSASELHADLDGSVPLSSLYRSLSVLAMVGVLAPHHGSGSIIRYELAEWLMGHHHHVVCDTCGAVDDIELSEDSEATLTDLVSAVTRSRCFVATNHVLEIGGLCTDCARTRWNQEA